MDGKKIALLLSFLAPLSAHAGATLKQVQVTDGSQVDLIFDSKVGKPQIQTEFFNDVIQISLKDVSVYPAKISSVSGSRLTKIFAYQYAPRLVRCRLTVKGKAESYKELLKISPNGRVLSVKLEGRDSDQLSSHLASPSRGENAEAQTADADEKGLLERVMKPAAPVAADAPKMAKTEKANEISDSESKPLTLNTRPLGGAKPLPSPWAALAKLGIVVAIFLGMALAVKRLRGGASGSKGMTTALQRFANGKLGGLGRLGKKEKMI
ncbi:MAG: hypothetical protein ACXWP5_07830, partial [Bdellovibrionota bacterium]